MVAPAEFRQVAAAALHRASNRNCVTFVRGNSMKCPDCDVELVPGKRDGVEMETCPKCKGMWLTCQELAQLEDEVFDFGDGEKGSLTLGSTPTTRKCPQCGTLMRSFEYRFYDLQMDFCEALHGYWLDAGEDKRVLELMRNEEKNLGRKVLAEDRFAAHLRYLRSGSVMDKIRDLLTIAIDPKPKPR
ncbi:MAG: zf-TFIIB domain-containing protein [Stellaceae bacterium]